MSQFELYGREREACLNLELHGRFIRNLAASLLGDGTESADVTQDVMLAALKSPALEHVPDGAKRAWLGKVVERMVFKRSRGAKARERRENIYAKSECSVSAPEDSLMRNEAVYAIGAAVHALREPYRNTVLLHFYEDRNPYQIAESMAVSVATVRSRLQRAKALLRESLMQEYGGSERSLCLALLPFVSRDGLAGSTTPVLLGSTTSAGLFQLAFWGKIIAGLKANVSLVALCGLVIFGLKHVADEEPLLIDPEDTSILGGSSPAELGDGPELSTAASEPQASEVSATNKRVAAEGLELPVPEFSEGGLIGRVLHEGKPLAGAKIEIDDIFSVVLLEDGPTDEYVVGRAPTSVVSEMLAKQMGRPHIPVYPADAARDTPLSETSLMWHPVRDLPSLKTDAEGRFRIESIPERGFRLNFIHEAQGVGLRTPVFLFESQESVDLGDFELLELATIAGRVQFGHALNLAGHEVFLRDLDESKCVTDALGRFRIGLVLPGEYLIGVDVGPGVYRPDWGTYYFIRIGAGEHREVNLRVGSEPCCVLSVKVESNGAPLAKGNVAFIRRGTKEKIRLRLDEAGRGVVNLPARVDLQCVANAYRNSVSMGADLFLAEGEASETFVLETSKVQVRVPLKLIPTPETCQLEFHTDFPDATAVRFSCFPNREGDAVALDAGGGASLTVPAWLGVEPVIQIRGKTWVYFESPVTFPAGDGAFEIDWDPTDDAVRYRRHDPALLDSKKTQAKTYALDLRWPVALTGETQTARQEINPLILAAWIQPEIQVEFDSVPTGLRDFEITLLRKKGNGWVRHSSWKKSVDVRFGETTTLTAGD